MRPVRSNHLEAWGDIARSGSRIIYGSDWPVSENMSATRRATQLLTLYWLILSTSGLRPKQASRALVTLPTRIHRPLWAPRTTNPVCPCLLLSTEQAIRAITVGGSRFVRADKAVGSLEVGELADIIVLQVNYFEVPEDELAHQKSLLTMIGSQVVWCTFQMT
jgi:predicted amidohydrolase YtcJ